jgi:hypothetical protein
MISDTVILVAVHTPADAPEPDAGFSVMLNSAVVMATDSDDSATPQYVQNAAGAIAEGVGVNVYQIDVVSDRSVSEVQGWLIDDHALDQDIDGIADLLRERNGAPIEDGEYTITDMRVRYDLGSDGTTSADPERDFDVDKVHGLVIRHGLQQGAFTVDDLQKATTQLNCECRTAFGMQEVDKIDLMEFLEEIEKLPSGPSADPLSNASSSPSPTL